MQCSWHDSWKAAILGSIQPYTTDVWAFIWSRSKLSFITVLLSSALMKDMKKGIISDFLCAGKVNDCALKNCREGAFVCVCVSVLAFWSVKQRFLIFAGILFENKWWRQQKVLQLFGLMSLPYTDVFCWPHSLNYLDYNSCCVHTLIIKSVFP